MKMKPWLLIPMFLVSLGCAHQTPEEKSHYDSIRQQCSDWGSQAQCHVTAYEVIASQCGDTLECSAPHPSQVRRYYRNLETVCRERGESADCETAVRQLLADECASKPEFYCHPDP